VGFMGFLRNNLSLKIFCLSLSIFLWAWVRYTQAPLSERNESQTSIYVPISFLNEREDLIMVKAPDKVIITVKGPPKVIDNIKPEHLKATVDLRDKDEGQSWADIVVKNPPGITITDVQPSRANITLDRLEKKSFVVIPKISGSVREGFMLGTPLLDPDRVEISGAQSTLKRIRDVEISLNVNNLDMDLKQRVQPEPLDKDGSFIPVKINPEYIKVDLPVRANLRTETLPVSPTIMGKPAAGYAVARVGVDPPVVTLLFSGKERALPEVLQTESILIKGEKSTVQKVVNVIQPPGGSLVNQKSVTVKIEFKKEGH
jgi:YbbR domain-containing protein